jgi:hypothetical protein
MVDRLFKNLFQEAKSPRRIKDPLAFTSLAKKEEESKGKKPDKKTVAVNEPSVDTTPLSFNTLDSEKRVEELAKSKYVNKATSESDPNKNSEDTNLEARWAEEKAQYGSSYIKNRKSVNEFFEDAKELPVLISSGRCRYLVDSIKNIITTNENVLAASETDPSFKELMLLLSNQSNFGLNSRKLSDVNANMPGYVFFLSLVFPLLEQNIVVDFFKNANTVNFFSSLQKMYSGTIFNSIEFSPETNFNSLEHIKDSKLKSFIHILQESVVSDSEEDAEIKRLLSIGLNYVALGMKESTIKAIGNNKHRNEISKTIYYSILSSYTPFNMDLFQLDNKKVADNMASNRTSDDFLTSSADTLVAAKRTLILEDPILTKGTLGRNIRDELAFTYAKNSDKLKKQRKNTRIAKVREVEKINNDTIKFFHVVVENFPELKDSFTELDNILEDFFTETSLPTKEEDKNQNDKLTSLCHEAFERLHTFAINGLDKLDVVLTNPDYLTNIFNSAIKNNPKILEELSTEQDRLSYVNSTYVAPFKATLERKYREFSEVTEGDIYVLLKTVVSITLAKTGLLSIKELKKNLEETYKKHLSDASLTSNGYRFDGFIFFRSVLKLDELLLEADKIVRKSPKQLEASLNTKKAERDTHADYFNQLQTARKRILDTEYLLHHMNAAVSLLFKKISAKIANADLATLRELVFGIEDTDKETNNGLSSFFNDLIKDISANFFSEQSPYKLYLLSEEDILQNSEKANILIVNDLIQKAKNKVLATEGVFSTNMDYYEGLTNDYIDFINLAASIQKNFSGLSMTSEGIPELNFNLDPASDSNSFFGNFFSGLPTTVSINPIATLCFHKFILSKLTSLVSPVLQTVSVDRILLPDVKKANKGAVSQIDAYFKNLYSVSVIGLKTAIKDIDARILEAAGNTTQRFVLSAENSSTYFIPGEINEDFNKFTMLLGSKAVLYALRKSNNLKNSAQLFFNSIAVSQAFESTPKTSDPATDPSSYAISKIQSAVDIISTAINLKAFSCATLGNPETNELLANLVNKYQKEGEEAKANDVMNNMAKATSLLDKFTKESGFIGTQLINKEDNRISNPILTLILDKFNKFITNEQIDKIVAEVKTQREESETSGTASFSKAETVLPKTGIMYLNTVITEKEPEETTPETPLGNVENPEANPTETNPSPFVNENGILKFTLQPIKNIVKELNSTISGETHTTLGKDKRYGTNVVQVKSYSQYISELTGAISVASNSYIDFYNGIGLPAIASEVKTLSDASFYNCSTLSGFFKVIAKEYIFNVGTQTTLLNLLAKLKPEGAITQKDTSTGTDTSNITLPELFSIEHFKAKNSNDMLEQNFNAYKGSKHVFSLLGMGYTISQILSKVNTILLEKGNDPEFLELADEEISLYSESSSYNQAEDDLTKSSIQPTPSYVEPSEDNMPLGNEQEFLGSPYYIKSRPWTASKLNSAFITRYCTLLDPNTYLSNNITPEEKERNKKAAISLLKTLSNISSTEQGKKINADITQAIKSGIGVNAITGNPVSSIITDETQFPSFVKENILQLAKQILEAVEGEKQLPNPTTETNANNNALQEDSRTLNILAAVLRVYYHVNPSQQGLLKADNTPFTFSFMEPEYWILQKVNSSLQQALKVIDKFAKRQDKIQFRINTKSPNNMAYIQVFHFAKLKALITNFYTPTSEQI